MFNEDLILELEQIQEKYEKEVKRVLSKIPEAENKHITFSGIPVKLHSGGGGLTSTALDYLRFAQMMLNRGELDGRRILKPETVDLMTRNHLPQHMLPLSYNGVARGAYGGYGFGLGYCINIDPDNTAAAGSAQERSCR